MTIEVLQPEALTPSVQSQIADLYRQLNAESSQRTLQEVLEDGNNVVVIICKVGNAVAGTALLSTYTVISGFRGIVDDVVVDTIHRGKGIGRQLMQRLVLEGQKMGLDEILLFTGHHRAPAIALYKSLGFELRNSGVYNLRLR